MSNLNKIIILTQILFIGTSVAVKLTGSKLDCVGVQDLSLSDLQNDATNPCQQINRLVLGTTNHLHTLDRHQLVQSCTCNLINKDFIWQTFYNEKIELLYRTVKSIIEPRETNCNEVTFMNLVGNMVSDGDGQNWMRETILNRIGSNEMLEKTEAYNLISNTCKHFRDEFNVFMSFFQNMSKLTHNEQFVHTLTLYNSNLFKEMVAFYACDLFTGFLL